MRVFMRPSFAFRGPGGERRNSRQNNGFRAPGGRVAVAPRHTVSGPRAHAPLSAHCGRGRTRVPGGASEVANARRFEGKVVVVTGASAGIGRAVARAFGKEGARVGLVARNADALENAAAEIRAAGGEALVQPLDSPTPRRWTGPRTRWRGGSAPSTSG